MVKSIFNRTRLPIIEKILDVTSMRQKAVASNIANVHTPGYQAREVDFSGTLRNALNDSSGIRQNSLLTSDPRHLSSNNDTGDTASKAVIKAGGTPDMEKEMALSAENQLLYATAAKIAGSRFRALRTSIKGRG